MSTELLKQITALSHEFGTADYVKGGGGNTSCKNKTTLWVKPSGTTLAAMTPDRFVAMRRPKILELYAAVPPAEPTAREALVKDLMAGAVDAGSSGRPSVEAPLHDSFDATYVVHTHPALVNGMTCAVNGEQACRQLFPNALWIPYTDPGYTLCMRVRQALAGSPTRLVFLQNHGVFVAAETPAEIRAQYDIIMNTLRNVYAERGVSVALSTTAADAKADLQEVADCLKASVYQAAEISLAAGNVFNVPDGPVSPDHIVYAKTFPYMGDMSADSLRAYVLRRGYPPKVLSTPDGVFGVGAGAKDAELALELAADAALVQQLAAAFGGLRFMSEHEWRFIENWEVESYRRQQMK